MTRKRTDPHKRLEQLQSEQAELEDFSPDPIEHWSRKVLRYVRDPRRLVTCSCDGTGEDRKWGGRCEICRGKGSNPEKKGQALYDRGIVYMLEICKASGLPPPDGLIRLIEFRLLGDRKRKAKDRDSPRWIEAAKYQAANPQCSIRDLRNHVKDALPNESLAIGTVSAWRNDPDFRADVKFYTELANDLEGRELS
jgi:hypothetical protein